MSEPRAHLSGSGDLPLQQGGSLWPPSLDARLSLGGLEPETPSEWKGKQRHFLSSSTSHPGAIPPMSHPVIPPWPNIAPKANEGAALCRWVREGPGGRGGPDQGTRQPTRGPFRPEWSRPEGQISGPLSHKRREVGETEGLTHRQWDHFLLGKEEHALGNKQGRGPSLLVPSGR